MRLESYISCFIGSFQDIPWLPPRETYGKKTSAASQISTAY